MLGHLGDESASAVVMDCRNGEVLAMATNPSFDPSLFNSGVSQAQWIEWTRNRRAPLINKAVAGVYAPGSTFKLVVAMAALEAKTLTTGDRINCPGYLDLGDTRFHCWSKYGHGSLDLHGGLKNSCDVFFYEVARRTGMDRWRRWRTASASACRSTSSCRSASPAWCRRGNGGSRRATRGISATPSCTASARASFSSRRWRLRPCVARVATGRRSSRT